MIHGLCSVVGLRQFPMHVHILYIHIYTGCYMGCVLYELYITQGILYIN